MSKCHNLTVLASIVHTSHPTSTRIFHTTMKSAQNQCTTAIRLCSVIVCLFAVPSIQAFLLPTAIPNSGAFGTLRTAATPCPRLLPIKDRQRPSYRTSCVLVLWATTTTTTDPKLGEKLDSFLDDPTNKFPQAVRLLKDNPDEIELSRTRFGMIFDAIEATTSAAEEQSVNTRLEQELLSVSQSRLDMTQMYQTLKNQGHLRLFGAVTEKALPAAGSHTVRPTMLEKITLLSMKALTPKPSNTLLYAGIGVAVLEALASAYFDLDLNLLFFVSITAALSDRMLLNGALSETVAKFLSPDTQPKITRHEAGHFLCSYLLGCPVEGYVLSAWAALQDPRFGPRGVSAGTSFFDPDLSQQISTGQIKRSSIDRYSIIVMAGIAAEAINYGRADGGAGDELALIGFLSNLNGGVGGGGGGGAGAPVWNELTIRNQARWGALQAVLILREYKECYDALVDALERGGSLGDCIYAIENAARTNDKQPLQQPLGYIIEDSDGMHEIWAPELPPGKSLETGKDVVAAAATVPLQQSEASSPLDEEEVLDALREYRKTVQDKLNDIDNKLEDLR